MLPFRFATQKPGSWNLEYTSLCHCCCDLIKCIRAVSRLESNTKTYSTLEPMHKSLNRSLSFHPQLLMHWMCWKTPWKSIYIGMNTFLNAKTKNKRKKRERGWEKEASQFQMNVENFAHLIWNLDNVDSFEALDTCSSFRIYQCFKCGFNSVAWTNFYLIMACGFPFSTYSIHILYFYFCVCVSLSRFNIFAWPKRSLMMFQLCTSKSITRISENSISMNGMLNWLYFRWRSKVNVMVPLLPAASPCNYNDDWVMSANFFSYLNQIGTCKSFRHLHF